MQVPEDQVGNPTLVDYLAEASIRLVQQETRGIVNVVGKDLLSRSEFGKALARAYGLDPEMITPVPTARRSSVPYAPFAEACRPKG
jgi:dTDP-4-dehydrorhamnose reductase